MLAMIVVATALSRISIVHTKPASEGTLTAIDTRALYDDMTHDMTEQLYSSGRDLRKRDEYSKYEPPKKLVEKKLPQRSPGLQSEIKKRPASHSEDIDVVDREDHVTQYLADLLVNTDSEITSLQATEPEDEHDIHEIREDKFFAFLTGLERTFEVEGAWSRPVSDDLKNEDVPNVLMDEE
ncbi:uncharacterized protein LOC113507603 isoform X2 [Trichoplusia ni]|uniref:Uncharacterized protein LOC113507603 isoform X2 n=1 Tax=Trichoplusia ni TaxID=7111 RepID=A0A7E5X1A1_TRINI|nr:uncharacterized protein LOC113507603 isoform X2 [Trichoplusia ni]